MFIAPVSDLLKGPEIIVVTDRCLYPVTFAALRDKCNRYWLDTFRIRIVSSLTTLKLVPDSSADYHSKTGALIAGKPSVTKVYFKKEVKNLCPLPGSKREEEMIARLLPGSHLLIGEQATKQAWFDREYTQWVRYISLHLPFLALQRDSARTRLLTVNVLSCYHTTCGQIKAEGVFGIARTFLGSGARSVLVALPISTKTLYKEKVQTNLFTESEVDAK